MNNNNQENSKPMMSYNPDTTQRHGNIEDITRPVEFASQPTVNSIPDPYLQDETFYDDWDNRVQEIDETDGRPSLPTLPDNRRLS